MKITENSTIEEILNHQKGEEVMAKHNVPCLGCPMAAIEMKSLQIKDVADMYNLDLNKIIEDLN